MKWKMTRYHKEGVRVVSLYPAELAGLDAAFRPKLERATGKSLNPQKSFCALCGEPVAPPGAFCARCGARL